MIVKHLIRCLQTIENQDLDVYVDDGQGLINPLGFGEVSNVAHLKKYAQGGITHCTKRNVLVLNAEGY